MKRTFAWLLIAALLLMLLPAVSNAAEEGEMLITSEAVMGAVGDVVKVDFYCYPNIPEGAVLDAFQGSLSYDAEILTLGAVSLRDEEHNLNSMLNSKSPIWMHTEEPGKMLFAFADAYGTDAQGFLFQIEFRIEKEGATSFVLNNISYNCIDATTFAGVGGYYLNPIQIGGVYTEGYELTQGEAPDATYAPLEPAIETPAPTQGNTTPHPSNGGVTVPQTSTLPEPSLPANTPVSGIVTPNPPVTSMPMNTPSGSQETAAPETTAPDATDANTQTETEQPGEETAEPNAAADTAEPIPVAETTPAPVEPTETQQTVQPDSVDPEPNAQPNRAVVIAVIAGIIVVILLAALAIILILIRNKRQREEE